MDPSPDASRVDVLRHLLTRTVELTQALTGHDAIWTTPFRASDAGAEMAQENASRKSECWPWMTVLVFSRLALDTAGEQARGVRAVLGDSGTSRATGVLSRATLESSSLVWWLLEPDIGAERRLCRTLVYRLHTAAETGRAVDRLELSKGEDPSGFGDLREQVVEEIAGLGLEHTAGRSGISCGKESWPSYTDRVADLLHSVWPEHGVPYAVLSAVAHSELLGLTRSLDADATKAGSLRPAAGESDIWLWYDTYWALGALVFAALRAASFLGAHEHIAALEDLIGDLDQMLPTLRPRH